MVAAAELFDLDAGQRLAAKWVALCRAKGALTTLPLALDSLGTWEMFTGRFDAAEISNAEGRDILSATGNPDRLGTRAVELLAPTWRGDEAQLRETTTALIRDSIQRRQEAGVWYSHYALSILEISLCNYRAALTHARVLIDDNGPYFGALVLPEAVEAAVHCGDRATAELAVERLAARAQTGGTDLALGLLARCRALTDKENAERHYVEAIEHLGRSAAAGELARAHLLFGEWLRRQRRRGEARHWLRKAHQSFQAIGAGKFAERAGVELAATGERARTRTVEGSDELTVRETQIARLVANGASNGEVAAQLFISGHTVEYHLRHIYQKHGVTSRTMLAAAFRDQRS
jgi:DNA-binding CsgD family transcriptional regulator